MNDERLAMWAIARVKGLGPAGLRKLLDRFGNASTVFESLAGCDKLAIDINENILGQLQTGIDRELMKAELENSIPEGCDIVALTEDNYPEKLRTIFDPPPVLYFKGDLNCLDKPTVAVVGSRKPSDYGLRMAHRFASELAAAGVTVISGLAFGIDACAHYAALETGGLTAAVFGCGLDSVYPPAHRELAGQIAESGCLISEFPKGTIPERHNFPIRNRIIAGLSDGVVVVEAAERSGALVTARIALEQNREVFAVPGGADSEMSFGPNDLIKQGAAPVTTVDDILSAFGWHKSEKDVMRKVDLTKLTNEELSLYNQISIQPVHLDDIVRRISLAPSKIAELILNLELKGFILRKPGNFVVKA